MRASQIFAGILATGCLTTTLCAGTAHAATSGEMVTALGVPPALVISHDLYTTSGSGDTAILFDGEDAASAFVEESSILISTGLASDNGLGDTDWGDDGSRDGTVFSIGLAVPEGAQSLSFRTRFSSREYLDGESQDRAFLAISVTPCGGVGCVSMPYDLVSVSEAVDTVNPALLRVINTEGIETLLLTFQVQDAENGSLDSAITISDFHFSENPSPSNGQFTSELPSEDVKTSIGTFRFRKEVMSIPGRGIPYELILHYNSRQTWSKTFGRKWSHNYEWRLQQLTDGTVHIRAGDGGSVFFEPSPDAPNIWGAARIWGLASSSFWSSRSSIDGHLERRPDGSYVYTNRQQLQHHFSATGLLTRIQDADGNALVFEHNARGRLSSVTDTRGNVADYFYTLDGTQLVTVLYQTSTTARQVEFSYFGAVTNEAGEQHWDLAYVWPPGEGPTSFTYDAAGNMLTAHNPDGNLIVDNTYRGELLVSSRDGKGGVDSYRYFTDTMEHTDRMGRVHLSEFDTMDRIRRKMDPLGNSWRFSYDDNGNRVADTDPLGNIEARTYVDGANLATVTDALGRQESYTYDERNNVIEAVDKAGAITRSTYDDANNLLRRVDANSNEISFTYNAAGQILSATDRSGNNWSFSYPNGVDLGQQVDPLNNSTSFVHDAFGNLLSVTDPNGSTSYQYDIAHRLTGIQDALGNVTTFTLNGRGQKTRTVLPDGSITRYQYDPNGRMTALIDAIDAVYSYGYTPLDQLANRTDPLGRTTSLVYDDGDRLVSVEDPAGQLTTATYDALGRRTSVTGPGGSTTSFEYDPLGRVVAETDALGNVTRNEYNERGQASAIVTARGDRIDYSYDDAGRLVSITYPDYVAEMTLDANGNALQSTGIAGSTIQREFDALNRLVSRTDPHGRTLRYEYDGVGNLTRLIYPNGDAVSYAYDALNRLIEVIDWAGHRTTYTWDSVGNLTGVNLPDGTSVTSSYDAVGRMTAYSAVREGGEALVTAEYEYDAAGLRTAAREFLPLDPTSLPPPATFTYDAANRIASMNGEPFEYDAMGNLTSGVLDGESTTLAYDSRDRLTGVASDRYEYDEEGLRIRATLDGETIEITQDPNSRLARRLEEYDADGSLVARYVYGIGPIARVDAAGNAAVFHFDALGNTVALTDIDGAVTDRYSYDPWGRLLGRTGNTANPFTFHGQLGVVDDGNGLFYMRTRYYAPELMRFTQADPMFAGSLLDPQSLNRYIFVLNNPIVLADPNGENPFLVGVLIGVGLEIGFDIAEYYITGDGLNPLDKDAWIPYFENNWLDLAIAGVTMGIFNARMARFAAKYGYVWIGRGIAEVFGAAVADYIEEKLIFPFLGVDNWTDMYGDTIIDYTVEGAEALGDFVYENVSDFGEAAGDFICDTAEDIGDWVSDTWHSIF